MCSFVCLEISFAYCHCLKNKNEFSRLFWIWTIYSCFVIVVTENTNSEALSKENFLNFFQKATTECNNRIPSNLEKSNAQISGALSNSTVKSLYSWLTELPLKSLVLSDTRSYLYFSKCLHPVTYQFSNSTSHSFPRVFYKVERKRIVFPIIKAEVVNFFLWKRASFYTLFFHDIQCIHKHT